MKRKETITLELNFSMDELIKLQEMSIKELKKSKQDGPVISAFQNDILTCLKALKKIGFEFENCN